MTMNFRNVQKSLINNVLGPSEWGRFRTIGFQRQGISGEETEDNSRLVQVYYYHGLFKKSAGRNTGPTQHDIKFRIDLTVSKGAEGDLSVLNDSTSSAAMKATALYNFQEAAALADESLDELFDIIYQILMDGKNYDLGLDEGSVSNRWVEMMEKDQPISRGEVVMLTGVIIFSCRVAELVTGDEGVTAENYDIDLVNINGDTEQKTGVAGDIGG